MALKKKEEINQNSNLRGSEKKELNTSSLDKATELFDSHFDLSSRGFRVSGFNIKGRKVSMLLSNKDFDVKIDLKNASLLEDLFIELAEEEGM